MLRRVTSSFVIAIKVAIIGFGKSFSEDEDIESILGYRDPLTNLLNLKAFESDRKNVENGYALVVIDIDSFKTINDSKGHLHGDMILKRLAGILERATGMHGRCYRLHGDEFALIVRQTEVDRICNEIRKNIREEDGFTVSQGIVLELQDGANDNAFNLADAALYESKRNGRDRITTSFPAIAA